MNFEEWPYFKRGFKDVSEAQCLWDFCISRRPQLVLEIGRYMGVSTRLFALAVQKWNGKVISIDGKPNPYVPKVLDGMGLSSFVELINKWSPWINPDVNWKVDMLYLDGDHTYIATLVDYHYFNFFVKPNGLIMFHDCLRPSIKKVINSAIRRDKLKRIKKVNNLVVFQKTELYSRRVNYQRGLNIWERNHHE